jgi:hypothetical protein
MRGQRSCARATRAAEPEYDVLITMDQSLRCQQNLRHRD